ncbi:MAG: hypothetical protein PWQ91_1731 [Eubacteriales bacterium]|nr:hypothetical protein [Eubacteriales bacterium]MDN5364668.1 hypothetical protein [Eubacteriales bacterium]
MPESFREAALKLHAEKQGKLEIIGKVKLETREDLSLAYTPGVAEPCRVIASDREAVFRYTNRGNTVAVVTDGSAVLGLGNIGPEAALPVMEGKALLFKAFAGVDAIPICLAPQEPEEIVKVIKAIAPSFGGINLEDISAPRCFAIEKKLKEELDIPVFHDDQHGTAVVVLAGLINALQLVEKDLTQVRIIINGSGSAGIAIARLLLQAGARDIIMCDINGAIYEGAEGLNPAQEEISRCTNRELKRGSLAEVIEGSDVFIGVSAGGVLSQEMVASMNSRAIIFAMANPIPEIMPEDALAAGAAIVATGRSDFPNQINNVLAFPGIFRGALDTRAKDINEEMKIAAAYAIAQLVERDKLAPEFIIPSPLDEKVAPAVAAAVAAAAQKSGVAREKIDPDEVARKTQNLIRRYKNMWNSIKRNK